MSTSCRSCKPGCVFIAIVVSLIVGIITAFLRITGAITLTPAFLWVILGISVSYLAVILYTATRPNNPFSCAYNSLTVLLFSIIFFSYGKYDILFIVSLNEE